MKKKHCCHISEKVIPTTDYNFRSMGLFDVPRTVHRDTRYILIIKAKEMHYFSSLFGKDLYMFRTDLLSIIRSLNTVFTAIGICHTSYVDCLLARSGDLTSLADRQHN